MSMISFHSPDGWYYRHWLFGSQAMPEPRRRHWLMAGLAFLAAGLSMSTRMEVEGR